jgi:glycosyltransferase involved in cell wall biosynthesis
MPAVLPVAILMATYRKDNPDHLAAAIHSIIEQSAIPSQIVIVVDGPLTEDLDIILANFERRHSAVTILRLPTNQGLAAALQSGLTICKEPFVARMDSDDVCHPDRLKLQYEFIAASPEIAIVSTLQPEFSESPAQIDAIKYTPERHDQIAAKLWWRNVISHPSVMFRKDSIMMIGGYRSIHLLEDYDLWIRCLTAGLKFACIQKHLLYMRVLFDQRRRRSGWKYACENIKWRWRLLSEGHIGLFQFMLLAPSYFVYHVIPAELKSFMYRLMGVRKVVRRGGMG